MTLFTRFADRIRQLRRYRGSRTEALRLLLSPPPKVQQRHVVLRQAIAEYRKRMEAR